MRDALGNKKKLTSFDRRMAEMRRDDSSLIVTRAIRSWGTEWILNQRRRNNRHEERQWMSGGLDEWSKDEMMGNEMTHGDHHEERGEWSNVWSVIGSCSSPSLSSLAELSNYFYFIRSPQTCLIMIFSEDWLGRGGKKKGWMENEEWMWSSSSWAGGTKRRIGGWRSSNKKEGKCWWWWDPASWWSSIGLHRIAKNGRNCNGSRSTWCSLALIAGDHAKVIKGERENRWAGRCCSMTGREDPLIWQTVSQSFRSIESNWEWTVLTIIWNDVTYPFWDCAVSVGASCSRCVRQSTGPWLETRWSAESCSEMGAG